MGEIIRPEFVLSQMRKNLISEIDTLKKHSEYFKQKNKTKQFLRASIILSTKEDDLSKLQSNIKMCIDNGWNIK